VLEITNTSNDFKGKLELEFLLQKLNRPSAVEEIPRILMGSEKFIALLTREVQWIPSQNNQPKTS
jgi:hypothetical protein